MSGGRVAASLADALESFDADTDVPPDPDVATIDGVRFSSLPLAVIDEGEQAAIHRLRQTLAPDGSQTEVADVIRLDRVTADEVADEAEALGFRVEAHRQVPQTHEYVGSTVVVLHA
jgi:hypothetical protein